MVLSWGGVYDNQGINIVSNPEVETTELCPASFTVTTTDERTAIYLGTYIRQWGHFLLDSCARLWVVLTEYAKQADVFVWTIGTDEKILLDGNYSEFLKLLGIYDKCIIIQRPVRYRKVIIPERGIFKSSYWSEEYSRLFDYAIERICSAEENLPRNENKRIFLSRTKLGRNDLGSKDMDLFFAKNGYSILYPERISLSALINIMNRAEVVASISGSTAHNFLFLPPHKHGIIIEKFALVNDYQYGINISRRLEVTHIDANLSLFAVSPGAGPFILCSNGYLQKFAKDSNYCFSPKKKRGLPLIFTIRKYLALYFDTYVHYPDKWIVHDNDTLLREAWNEAMSECGYDITKISFLKFIKNKIKLCIQQIRLC